jgi:hypothetical protein
VLLHKLKEMYMAKVCRVRWCLCGHVQYHILMAHLIPKNETRSLFALPTPVYASLLNIILIRWSIPLPFASCSAHHSAGSCHLYFADFSPPGRLTTTGSGLPIGIARSRFGTRLRPNCCGCFGGELSDAAVACLEAIRLPYLLFCSGLDLFLERWSFGARQRRSRSAVTVSDLGDVDFWRFTGWNEDSLRRDGFRNMLGVRMRVPVWSALVSLRWS